MAPLIAHRGHSFFIPKFDISSRSDTPFIKPVDRVEAIATKIKMLLKCQQNPVADSGGLFYLEDCSSIIPNELPTPIIEEFHGLIGGVKNDPVMPYGLFPLLADPFNLRVPEIFKLVMIICGKFMFSHFDALLLL
jgi:hypothetical protein